MTDTNTTDRVISWSYMMASGIPDIDAQHRRLISMANDVLSQLGPFRDASVEGALLQLRDYAATHFAAEEHWMRSQGYGAVIEHAREHCEIEGQLDHLWACRATITAELFKPLSDAIVRHVIKEANELRMIARCAHQLGDKYSPILLPQRHDEWRGQLDPTVGYDPMRDHPRVALT